jgi:transforming growth factor-beta-induced protein
MQLKRNRLIAFSGIGLALLFLGIVSLQCSNGNGNGTGPGKKSIVDIVQEDNRFDTLETALTAANLIDTLNSSGPFTVFAPTDSAFSVLPPGLLDTLLATPQGTLKSILLYHVAEGSLGSSVVTAQDSITTLQGSKINVTVSNGNVVLNDSILVTSTDIQASNGIIHVINGVLIPPIGNGTGPGEKTIVDIVIEDNRFDTLEAALTAANLVDTLNSSGPFTVFAPTDSAFSNLAPGLLGSLLADPQGNLRSILLYHVAGDSLGSSAVAAQDSIITLQGSKINVTVSNGNVFLNDSIRITTTDIQASNGIIHIINGILTPPNNNGTGEKTIVEIVTEDDRFDTLEAALTAANLVDTLNGSGPFTVFAPPDSAFSNLAPGLLDTLLANPQGNLLSILLYHVAGDSLGSSEVTAQDSITTLQGNKINVTVSNGNVILNDSIQVTSTDIPASNGIIHVINGVLIPPGL